MPTLESNMREAIAAYLEPADSDDPLRCLHA
jgi:hypothetical protein